LLRKIARHHALGVALACQIQVTGVLYKMKGAGGNNLNDFGQVQTTKPTMDRIGVLASAR
jgi:hypothetical protein